MLRILYGGFVPAGEACQRLGNLHRIVSYDATSILLPSYYRISAEFKLCNENLDVPRNVVRPIVYYYGFHADFPFCDTTCQVIACSSTAEIPNI